MKTAKKIFSAALAAATLLAAPLAFPCGAPFGAGMNVDPHQDIILVHRAGVETYVFQPTFCGDAKDFGVILPIPAMLEGEPALGDEKAFAAAETLSKPAVVERTECRNRGTFGGAADAGAPGMSDGTSVVKSGTVGFLDYSVLEAKDEASFTSWLDANGYPYDTASKSTFGYYVSKKWFFVAFKVSNGAVPTGTKPCKGLGPIKLSFKTAEPVVPSRMATAGNTTSSSYGFSWRVFGITDSAQQLAFVDGEGSTRKYGFAGTIPDAELPKLDGLAKSGDRLTKLTVWFDKSQTDDVKLKFFGASDYRETVYSTTYIDCDAGTVDPIDPPPGGDEDAGPTNGAQPNEDGTVKAGGCSTSNGSSSMLGLGLGLAAIALLRRRR
jgi:MYXO-CTERM domain-containing protein